MRKAHEDTEKTSLVLDGVFTLYHQDSYLPYITRNVILIQASGRK